MKQVLQISYLVLQPHAKTASTTEPTCLLLPDKSTSSKLASSREDNIARSQAMPRKLCSFVWTNRTIWISGDPSVCHVRWIDDWCSIRFVLVCVKLAAKRPSLKR